MFSLSYNKTQIKIRNGSFFYIIYLQGKQVEKWTVIYECLQPNKEKLIGKKIFFLTSTDFETLILLRR